MSPDWSVLLTIIGMVFTAGITWGVMSAKARTSEKRIEQLLLKFEQSVNELKTLSTELQVLRVSTARSESDIAELEERVRGLEIAVAKLQRDED